MMTKKLFCFVCALGLASLASACSDSSSDSEDKDTSVDTDSSDTDSSDTDTSDTSTETDPPSTDDTGTDTGDAVSKIPDDIALPIVFVHGFAGSAQQYASQAMRFAANGYPQDRIVGFDHDGVESDVSQFIPDLDAFVDATLARFGAEKVYLVGHSRGTMTSATYLGDPARLAKVAKVILLDGMPCLMSDIPCIAPNQAGLPGQKHVEVATSKESFEMQYEFLVGEAPGMIDIVAQTEPVEVRGRAVYFPANTGRTEANLDVWEVDPATGMRTQEEPVASFVLPEDGSWGPATLSSDKHYELVIYSEETGLYHHFYPQPFLRSSYLERLLSGDPESETRVNTNTGPGHTAIIVMRMREFLPSDILEVSTASASGDQPAVNAITETNIAKETTMGVGEPIALHLHDDTATPGESTLGVLDWFSEQPFQTGIDIYMPAADPPDGAITLTNMPRGDTTMPQVLNIPNWASSVHTITAVFSDFPHE